MSPAMQVDPDALHDLARSLAGGLRWEFRDVAIELGDSYMASVEGSVDPLGGVVAAVHDGHGAQRVQLMPSSRDDMVVLAACACASPGARGCAHLWAVLRAIDAQRAWPPGLSMPAELAMTRPNDPELELIAEGAGVRITGTRAQGGIRAQSVALAQPAATALWLRSECGVDVRTPGGGAARVGQLAVRASSSGNMDEIQSGEHPERLATDHELED